MPAATRFANRIQDMDDYAAALIWAGAQTFGAAVTFNDVVALSDNVTQADAKYIATDEIRARDSDGLKLFNHDGNNGIFVKFGGGHTGIGTVLPAHMLDIYDLAGGTTARIRSSSGPALLILDAGVGSDSQIHFRRNGDNHWLLSSDESYSDDFFFYNYNTDSTNLTLQHATGYIGINVVNPAQRLSVDGNILQTTGDYLATDEVRAINGDGLKLYDDGSNGIFIKDGGDTGIGTISPASLEAKGGVLSLSATGGMTIGDSIGNLSFITDDSSFTGTFADGIGAEISAICESATGAAWGLAFSTATVSGSNRAERVRIDFSGRVGVNIDTPTAQVHIDQASDAAAIPVLTLDQADIDQPIVKVIGTAESGSADRSLVAASDFTTPGAIVAWEMVYVEDVGNRFTDAKYYRPLYAIPTA